MARQAWTRATHKASQSYQHHKDIVEMTSRLNRMECPNGCGKLGCGKLDVIMWGLGIGPLRCFECGFKMDHVGYATISQDAGFAKRPSRRPNTWRNVNNTSILQRF